MKKTEKKRYIHPMVVAIVNIEPICADINGVSRITAGNKSLYNLDGDSYDSESDDDWMKLGARGTSPDFWGWDSD